MSSVLLLIPVFEMLGLLGFVHMAQVPSISALRYLPLILAIVPVIWIAVRQGRSQTPGGIVRASLLIALAFVAGFQALGLVYTGLAKDIDIFSTENFIRLGLIATGVFVGHIGLFVLLRIPRCLQRGASIK